MLGFCSQNVATVVSRYVSGLERPVEIRGAVWSHSEISFWQNIIAAVISSLRGQRAILVHEGESLALIVPTCVNDAKLHLEAEDPHRMLHDVWLRYVTDRLLRRISIQV